MDEKQIAQMPKLVSYVVQILLDVSNKNEKVVSISKISVEDEDEGEDEA